MTDDIKKSLKERSKLTKTCYKNGQQKIDYDKVLIARRKLLKLKMTTLIK